MPTHVSHVTGGVLAALLSAAVPLAAAADTIPLPQADRTALDQLLGSGVVGDPVDAGPLATADIPLRAGTWTYQVVAGKKKGQTEERRPHPARARPVGRQLEARDRHERRGVHPDRRRSEPRDRERAGHRPGRHHALHAGRADPHHRDEPGRQQAGHDRRQGLRPQQPGRGEPQRLARPRLQLCRRLQGHGAGRQLRCRAAEVGLRGVGRPGFGQRHAVSPHRQGRRHRREHREEEDLGACCSITTIRTPAACCSRRPEAQSA